MALTATVYHLRVTLSDLDRGVYEALDLRLARHPSETLRYLLTRAIAYCLAYEDGIAFSKGGLSTADEPPLCIRDGAGGIATWIDIGAPSAERLHKAAKAARRVVVFTTAELSHFEREAAARPIHRAGDIEIWRLAPSFVEALEERVDRNTALELVRQEERLYATVLGASLEGTVTRHSLGGQ